MMMMMMMVMMMMILLDDAAADDDDVADDDDDAADDDAAAADDDDEMVMMIAMNVGKLEPPRNHLITGDSLYGEIGRIPLQALVAGLGDLVMRIDGRDKGSINGSSPE